MPAGRNRTPRATGARFLTTPATGGLFAHRYVHLLVLAVAALAALPAQSQDQPVEKLTVEAITREMIEARIKEAEESQELGDDAKSKIRELYQQAFQDLDVAANLAAQAAAFDDMATKVQDKLQATKAQLDQLPSKASVHVPETATFAELEQLLKKEETELTRLKQELVRLEGEPARRQARRAELPSSETLIRERLANIDRQLSALPPVGELPLLTTARLSRARVQRQTLEHELATGTKELAAYAAEAAELLPLQRDLAAQLAGQAEARVTELREMTNVRRQEEAERLAKLARLEAARTHPLLQPEAKTNQVLAAQSQALAPKIRALSHELERTNQALDQVKSDFKTIQEKADRGGLTEGVGLLLRRELATVPDVRAHRRNLQARRGEMRTVELSLIELDDQRYALSDTERVVERMMVELRPLPSDVDAGDLKRALRELLESRKGQLDNLLQSQDSYFDLQVKLDLAEDELIQEVDAYVEYLRERVLWIRSAQLWKPGDLKSGTEAIRWFLDPGNWANVAWAALPYGQQVRASIADDRPHASSETAAAVAAQMGRRPWPLFGSIVFVSCFVLLLANSRRLRLRIGELGELAARRNCQQFLPTIHTLAYTTLISLLWPSLLLFFCWRLTAATIATDSARAVGYGLGATGTYFLSFEFLRQICRGQGLAAAHFDWPAEIYTLLRRSSRTLLIVTLPPVFVLTTLHGLSNESWQNSLARLCCVAVLIVISVMSHRVFRPQGAFFKGVALAAPTSWLYRLRRLWHWTAVFSPLALVALALAGYYYTAYQLAFRLLETLWLLLILLVLASLVQRWLRVNRRKMAVEQALERRRAAQAQAVATERSAMSFASAVVSESEIDLKEMSQQSRQLLQVSLFVAGILGLWFIWVDVFPALGILEGVRMWQISRQGELQWITLKELVFGLMILGLTVLAVKNIPGLLELTLLQRIPMDAGARYACTTCTRYVITVVGLIIAFRTIGVDWSQYQWLVAAASVGLGFGLQEILANFASGLIVLLERPMRVGDIVTVEGVTGIVSKIRMRATTVTNWDRQELIVPNKDFVTGKLLNWTLSNAVNRVLVNVGVAYGTDTDQVTQLLLTIAESNPFVLDDPAPMATFEEFGDSTLNFVLRCYLPNLDNRLVTIHELHSEIARRFSDSGIEIAFPQRDLHIRSLDTTLVVDDRRNAGPPGDC